MRTRKIIIALIAVFGFILTSCQYRKALPKPELIPFHKSDYNGFYQLGENGKSFTLQNNDSLIYKVIKDGFIGINNIENASVIYDDLMHKPMISIELNKKGTEDFRKLTKENIHKNLAVIFNNTLFMCPIVQSEIKGGKVQVTGNFNTQEVVSIVHYINLNKGK